MINHDASVPNVGLISFMHLFAGKSQTVNIGKQESFPVCFGRKLHCEKFTRKGYYFYRVVYFINIIRCIKYLTASLRVADSLQQNSAYIAAPLVFKISLIGSSACPTV